MQLKRRVKKGLHNWTYESPQDRVIMLLSHFKASPLGADPALLEEIGYAIDTIRAGSIYKSDVLDQLEDGDEDGNDPDGNNDGGVDSTTKKW